MTGGDRPTVFYHIRSDADEPDIGETLSPLMRQMFSQGTAETKAKLSKAMDQALAALAECCTKAMVTTPQGRAMIYGPDTHGVDPELMVLVATPENAVLFLLTEWPEFGGLPRDAGDPGAWVYVANAVNAEDCVQTMQTLAFRMGGDGLATVRRSVKSLHDLDADLTPLLVALCAADGGRTGGAVMVLPLPAPAHVQRAEAAGMM